MPVPFSKIAYRQLLGHQVAYELIDLAGRKRFNEWDILEFEKAYLGTGSTGYICNKDDHNAIMDSLVSLDQNMPFLKFNEPGQHYAYELFLTPPEHWSSRGAPLFWAFTSRQFTFDKLPMKAEAFESKFKTIVQSLGIPYGVDDYVYIERFAAGGMSSGMVGGLFVAEALDILLQRLKKYQ